MRTFVSEMRAYRPNWSAVKAQAARQLRRGISPRRLALTLALGFVLGCIPVVGIPTALCAMIAVLFRLNLPVIQAANYAAMPFQVALILPFARLGSWMVPFAAYRGQDWHLLAHSPFELVRHSSLQLLEQIGLLAGQALVAWLVVAMPVALVLTLALTRLLRRVPAIATSEAGN